MNAVFECIAKWETAYALSYGSPMPRSAILLTKADRQNFIKRSQKPKKKEWKNI